MNRPLAVLFLAVSALVSAGTAAAQCAMCREAAAAQRKEQAEAFNRAIVVLGAPPALAFAAVGLALWRRRDGRPSDPQNAGLQ
jgi:hypothetical protein